MYSPMTPRTYFRLALLAPLVFPYGAIALSATMQPLTAQPLLALALGFGGLGYAALAALLWVRLGKLETTRQMVRLSWCAPVLFIPMHAVGWLLWYGMGGAVAFTLHGVFGPLLMFVVYILLVGYLFVAATNLGFQLLRWWGVVVEPVPSP